jgi:hypothetical protein
MFGGLIHLNAARSRSGLGDGQMIGFGLERGNLVEALALGIRPTQQLPPPD